MINKKNELDFKKAAQNQFQFIDFDKNLRVSKSLSVKGYFGL
jgi:hypothetical protein